MLLQLLVQQLSGGDDATRGPRARPLLAPWLRRADAAGRVLLEYADSVLVLEGRAAELLLPELLPLLDGERSGEDVVATLGEGRRAAVEHALAELTAAGALVEGPATADENALLAAALSGGAVSPSSAAARLRAARVAIAGSGGTAAELERLLAHAVGRAGRLDWDDEAALRSADLVLAAPSPAELPRLRGLNELLLDLRRPWLQALPFNGRAAVIGPLFLPGETCCHACYGSRRAAALGGGGVLEALDRVAAPYPVGGFLAAAVAALAATVALRWVSAADPALPGALFALELEDGIRVERHRVLRVPRCHACSGSIEVAPPLPWAEELAS